MEEVARKIIDAIGPAKKWDKPSSESGLFRLSFAGAGSQVFMSRNFKMTSIWQDGENTDLLDAYTIDLPEMTQYYLVFYRMDFPPLEGNPFSEEILRGVEAGNSTRYQ
jgi:hypothetical protein